MTLSIFPLFTSHLEIFFPNEKCPWPILSLGCLSFSYCGSYLNILDTSPFSDMGWNPHLLHLLHWREDSLPLAPSHWCSMIIPVSPVPCTACCYVFFIITILGWVWSGISRDFDCIFCISLMTNAVRHPSTCFLAICIYIFGERSFQILCLFFNGLSFYYNSVYSP